MSIMLWVTDKGQKQLSTLSCDSSYALFDLFLTISEHIFKFLSVGPHDEQNEIVCWPVVENDVKW